MKIERSELYPQQWFRPLSDPGEHGSTTFSGLLAHLRVSAASQPESDAARADATPAIGDGAAEFGEKPIVLLVAVPLGDAPSSRRTTAIEQLAGRVAEAAASAGGRNVPEAAPLRSQTWNPFPARTAGAVPLPVARSAVSGIAPVVSPVTRPTAAENPADVMLGMGPGSKIGKVSIPERAAGPAGKPARPAGAGSAHGSSSLHAALVATEAGLKLVLRAAGLSAEEHAQLSDRLTDLFAQMGEAPPELVIYEPANSDRKG